MSASAHFALRALRKPVAALPPAVQMPLVGWFWVLFNIFVVWFGVAHGHSIACSVLAGGVDGTVISVIAVAKASVRFQAGVTGLLGGLSLNRLDSDGNVLSRIAEKVHYFVDWMMNELKTGGADSPVHAEIQSAVLRIVWTAAFVILASLVAEWVRAAREESAVVS